MTYKTIVYQWTPGHETGRISSSFPGFLAAAAGQEGRLAGSSTAECWGSQDRDSCSQAGFARKIPVQDRKHLYKTENTCTLELEGYVCVLF